MKKYTQIVSVIGITTALSFSAQAAVLSAWENDDLAASTSSTLADETHAGFSTSTLAVGPGIPSGVTWPQMIGALQSEAGVGTSLADAITNNEYLSFTITPAGNVEDLDYTSLDIRIDADDFVSYALLSSAVGSWSAGNVIDTYVHSDSIVSETFNTNLSGVTALQDNTSAVEFRLYVFALDADTFQTGIGAAFAGLDGSNDLVISGNVTLVAVPEPSSLALLGLGAFLIYGGRKRLAVRGGESVS